MPSEKTAELGTAVDVEAKRQHDSHRDRVNRRTKHALALNASPPTVKDLTRSVLFIDNLVQMSSQWHATLSKYNALVTKDPHKSNVFISNNPWEPSNAVITWAACLVGAWVISPACFVSGVGPCVKYKGAIFVKRQIWVSEMYRASNQSHWLILLEVLNSYPTTHRWKLLGSAAEWAVARAAAERQKAPSQVIALVGSDEAQTLRNEHVFDVASAIPFLATVDPTRGSVGLLKM